MVFNNPWGLIALAALPAILALHFFRSRRRVQRIGGLHLWEFARVRLPIGGRFDRLRRSFSLYSQLLAALIAALLIAGFDIPLDTQQRQYTVIVDDSVSMIAGSGSGTPAQRARDFLIGWASDRDRYTVIAAGQTPRMLAGPFATRTELRTALAAWQPEDVACDLEAATNLATKFITGDESVLFLGDRSDSAEPYGSALQPATFGRPQDNAAFVHVERIRTTPQRDRIVAGIKNFSSDAMNVTVTARTAVLGEAESQELLTRDISLAAGESSDLSFETTALTSRIDLKLSDDALAADNLMRLGPVAIKPVRVTLSGFGGAATYFQRAAAGVPYVELVDAAAKAGVPGPDLLFTTTLPANTTTWRTVLFPAAHQDNETSSSVAQGNDVLIDPNHMLTEDMTLGGVLWPYFADLGSTATTFRAGGPLRLLTMRGETLLSGENFRPEAASNPSLAAQGVDAHEPILWRMNLLWDRTNIYRQAAWPILIQSIIEECRATLPGMARSDFRQGEPVALPFAEAGQTTATKQRIALMRDGRQVADWDVLPPQLSGLGPGNYEIARAGGAPLSGASAARFSVNLLSPGESDLSHADTHRAEVGSLVPASMRHSGSSPIVYYLMLLSLLVLTGASWIFQDTSR